MLLLLVLICYSKTFVLNVGYNRIIIIDLEKRRNCFQESCQKMSGVIGLFYKTEVFHFHAEGTAAVRMHFLGCRLLPTTASECF